MAKQLLRGLSELDDKYGKYIRKPNVNENIPPPNCTTSTMYQDVLSGKRSLDEALQQWQKKPLTEADTCNLMSLDELKQQFVISTSISADEQLLQVRKRTKAYQLQVFLHLCQARKDPVPKTTLRLLKRLLESIVLYIEMDMVYSGVGSQFHTFLLTRIVDPFQSQLPQTVRILCLHFDIEMETAKKAPPTPIRTSVLAPKVVREALRPIGRASDLIRQASTGSVFIERKQDLRVSNVPGMLNPRKFLKKRASSTTISSFQHQRLKMAKAPVVTAAIEHFRIRSTPEKRVKRDITVGPTKRIVFMSPPRPTRAEAAKSSSRR